MALEMPMLTTVGKQILKLDMSNDADAYINEAWADFFAAQVAGGTNYFHPEASFGTGTSTWHDKMNWCNGTRSVEDNFGGSGLIAGTSVQKLQTDVSSWDGYTKQIARVASILHDAFDGNSMADSSTVDVPGNCGAWAKSASGQVDSNGSTHLNQINPAQVLTLFNPPVPEEGVALPGSALPKVVRNWLALEGANALLEEDTFFQGLSQTMTDAGYSACDVCRVYLLHQANDQCPSYSPQGNFCGMTCPLGEYVDPTNGTCSGIIIY